MSKLRIGMTIGDINGIGLEVIIKTVQEKAIQNMCTPVIYGSGKAVSFYSNLLDAGIPFQALQDTAEKANPQKINVVNCWQENVPIEPGKVTEAGGKYAALALDAAIADLKAGHIDALVTAPINKEAMKMSGFPYPGHTELLAKELGTQSESLMFMVSDVLRVGVITNHLPIQDVAQSLKKELVMKKIQAMHDSLTVDFGLERPTIAVLGLNPHAGDGGAIGKEDEAIIRPAIVEMKKKGIFVTGPHPADGFFGSGQHARYDGILATYHDQGLIPFKLLAFGGGTNYTAGLSHVRTSPDHGTAYDIAGKNTADSSSFRQALFTAVDIIRNRRDHHEMHANKLGKKSQAITSGEDEVIVED